MNNHYFFLTIAMSTYAPHFRMYSNIVNVITQASRFIGQVRKYKEFVPQSIFPLAGIVLGINSVRIE